MNSHRDNDYLKAFGEHLRKLRTERNLSQEDLAGKADLTLSQIGRIERGLINTTISTIKVIAIALEIPPKELLDFTYNP